MKSKYETIFVLAAKLIIRTVLLFVLCAPWVFVRLRVIQVSFIDVSCFFPYLIILADFSERIYRAAIIFVYREDPLLE